MVVANERLAVGVLNLLKLELGFSVDLARIGNRSFD